MMGAAAMSAVQLRELVPALLLAAETRTKADGSPRNPRSRRERVSTAALQAWSSRRVPVHTSARARARARARAGGGEGEEQQQQQQQRPFDLASSLARGKGKRLSELSTLGIGGPANYFVEVHDESQLASVLRYCRDNNLRHFILGKGSNCLFDDRGFDGCVILNSLDFLENKGQGVYRVGSGYSFNRLGTQCSKDGFTGLEFASGIPGTVGGAIYMNASANKQETADVLKSVEILTPDDGKIVHVKDVSNSTAYGYGYRKSPYQTMETAFAIVAATFELSLCCDARERQRTFLEGRRKSQPVTEKSAGCIFRNPGTGSRSAGALIEQAGLKGLSVGQAKVSTLHANFLLNAGFSSSKDMLNLIQVVKEHVSDKFGINLVEEVIHVPYC